MSSTPHIHHRELLAEIEAFRNARNIAKTSFGDRAIGDPALINDIENGRELRSKTIAAIRLFMASGVTHAERKAQVAA